MNQERREKAIAWIKEEIRSLELAPQLNGCPMTPEWSEQLDIMRTCLEAVSDYHHDNISIAEDAESEQETLQRAMDEYKARAEKAETQAQVLETANKILTARITKAECRAERAEKCIAEIKSARDHTRPAYVVDQILEKWRERKEE